MAKKRLSRKQRERLRHRQEILDTALKLFSERGFHNVSMQQIAEASEFAVGTLYNFFVSKEMLFEELISSCGERIVGTLTAILDAPGTEVDRLTNFIRNLPILLEEHAEFVKLYVSELGMRGAKLSKRPQKEDIDTVLNTRLQQLLESGIRKGIFRSVDPVITSKAIHTIIETLAFEVAGRFDKAEAKDMFDKVEQLFVGGLLLPEDQGND
jgi:TetR/AcrR family transcriptional regulator